MDNIQQEILERIVRIETQIDGYNATKEKTDQAFNIAIQNSKDIQEIQDNLKWLWRTTTGALIIAAITAAIKFF